MFRFFGFGQVRLLMMVFNQFKNSPSQTSDFPLKKEPLGLVVLNKTVLKDFRKKIKMVFSTKILSVLLFEASFAQLLLAIFESASIKDF